MPEIQNPHRGGCGCGNVLIEAVFSQPLADYQPRACDCSYCQPRGVAFVSDPQGQLCIQVQSAAQLRWERQGSEQAEFLLCLACNSMVGALYSEEESRIGAINVNLLCGREHFAPAVVTSPRTLPAADKLARWRRIWFPNVEIAIGNGGVPDA